MILSLVGEDIAQRAFLQLSIFTAFAFSSTTQTVLQSTLDDLTYSNILSQCSIHGQACLLALLDHFGYACAWFQVLPSPQLGLTIPPAEFIVALCLWLGIPVFSETAPSSCNCHQLVDHFGDHLIGCSHGPLCIRHHNALCNIIYFT